jgi:signal peptidase II
VGGALGNALDRATIGAVIDFIHYTIPNVISNVSNLADHAIVGGVILILFDSWVTEPRRRARERRSGEASGTADSPPAEGV